MRAYKQLRVVVTCCVVCTTATAQDFELTRKGVFDCKYVDNQFMTFENGYVTGGKDRPDSNHKFQYVYGIKPENEKSRLERQFVEVSDAEHAGVIFSSWYLGYDAGIFAVKFTDDKFEVLSQGRVINLKRIYKEDWTGFDTKYFTVDEGSVFSSALKCKHTVLK